MYPPRSTASPVGPPPAYADLPVPACAVDAGGRPCWWNAAWERERGARWWEAVCGDDRGLVDRAHASPWASSRVEYRLLSDSAAVWVADRVQRLDEGHALLWSAGYDLDRSVSAGSSLELAARGGLHDVANLLTGALGEWPDGAIPEVRRHVGLAARICRVALDARRVVDAAPPSTQLCAVLDEAVGMIRASAAPGDAQVTLATPRCGVAAAIDETDLLRLLLNLLGNGLRAAGPGGRVTVGCAPLDASAPAPAGGETAEFVRLTIADDGPGFPAELLANGPQLGLSLAEAGHGLGLASSHRRVEELGGRLILGCSTELGGAEVIVELPRAIDGGRSCRPVEIPKPACTERLNVRVLVADDDPVVAAVALRMLQSVGATVCCGQTAVTARAALPTLQPGDLVLLDATLEGGAVGLFDAVPAGVRVAVTSGRAERDVRAAFAGRELTFLAKPFDRDELLSALRACPVVVR